MSIEVVRPGMLATVQDLGRFGYQKFGVIVNGAMDTVSHRIANLLVGNNEKNGTLEMNMQGGSFLFHQKAVIAITGADMNATIDGITAPMWRPILVDKGAVLTFGFSQKGCRTYVSVAGGFSIQKEMNSESTYLLAKFGGFQGRKLAKGDQLTTNEILSSESRKIVSLLTKKHDDRFSTVDWSVSTSFNPIHLLDQPIRVLVGKEFDWFDQNSQQSFFKEPYQITPHSDRMGYRLKGTPLQLHTPRELISEAVTFGTIQVPAEGNPIVLMADRQTTGGYPKIAQVITTDLAILAQKKPGDSILFQAITHDQAEYQYILKEREFQQLKKGLHLLQNT